MPDNQPVQNSNDAPQFEADYAETYNKAETQSILDFAAQFEEPAPQDTAANDATPSADKKFNFTDAMGSHLVTQGQTAVDQSMGAGRDIGLGIIHSPRSIIRGATKGVNNMVSFFDELDDWVPKPDLFDPKTGDFSPGFRTDAAIKEAMGVDGFVPQIPVIDQNKTPTVTGALIEGISQFAVGLKGVDKFGNAIKTVDKIGEALTKGGRSIDFLKNVGRGAAADLLSFDTDEQRLSNVIEQVPALKNPVTAYLAADPNDNKAEALLKQGIEGLTLGAVGDVLFDGVRLLKKGKQATAGLKDEGKTIDDLFSVPPEDAAGLGLNGSNFEFLGRTDSDSLFIQKQQKLDMAADEVNAAFGKTKAVTDGANPSIDDYEINFARIEGPDDIKRLMDEMVNNPALKPSIEDARRGKIDNRATLVAATDIDGFDSLMSRNTGDAFNAETIVAARKVYYDTTTKLMDAAKRAAAPEASDIDQFNFRKMVATHHAVQKEFMGVRAEAGRALQAWRIPVGGSGGENVRALEQVLNEFGGASASKELAKRMAEAGNRLNTTQINMMTTKAASARTIDAISEIWTLGLLTSPTTHVVNISSNVLTGLYLGVERLAQAASKETPVTLREGGEFFVAMLESQKGALKNAAQAFRTGQTGIGISKLDLPRIQSSSREVLDPEGKAGIFSKALDGYGAILSKYAGGALAFGDEYQKTVLYQSQLRALAMREGIAQGMEGAALKNHIAKTLAEPSANIRADAVSFANYGTFTKELGSIGQSVQRATADNPMLRFIVPFVRTPANIFKFAFERTPLAPLSSKVRADIQAGGLRASTAMAKISMGTSIMAIGTDLSQNGQITGGGPSDRSAAAKLRATGWQPYSIKIGDTYYSYSRFEPVATVLGLSADISEIISNYESYDLDAQEQADELVTAASIAVGNQLIGKTFMSGFADLMEVLSDPGRYGEGYIQRFAGSFVPAGVAAIERAVSPEMESVFNMADKIKSRIPGASEFVPKRRNIWGEEIQYFYPEDKSIVGATAERLTSLFNPVYYSKEKDAPIDRWMLKNGFDISMPQKRQVFDGVPIDLRDHADIYDRLVRLRGNELPLQKYGNQTMKSFFDNLVNEEDPYGKHISFFSAFGNNFDDQQNMINQVVNDYTRAAKDQIQDEYPELGTIIQRERRNAAMINQVRPSARQTIEEAIQ